MKQNRNLKILAKPENLLDTPIQHNFGLCERHSLEIFAEPLNVITSFCFFITAFLILRLCLKNNEIRSKWILDIYVLTFLIFCIGTASTIFHMVPNYYTELMDISFIIIFINLYVLSVLVRVAYLNWFQVFVAFLAFLGTTNFFVSKFPNALNDSIGYLSTMMALVFIAVYLTIRKRASAKYYLLAALVGITSLFFRSIDNEICDVFSHGSHFLWHSLNSTLIYILMKQLIRSINRRARMLQMAGEYGL
jgi:hypothetical protein